MTDLEFTILKPPVQKLFNELCVRSEFVQVETKADGCTVVFFLMRTICAFANKKGFEGCYGLLVKYGAGTATTYTLNRTRLQAIGFRFETPHLEAETSHLSAETQHLEMSDALRQEVENLGYRPRKEKIFSVIINLCLLKPQTKEELMQKLDNGEQLIRKYFREKGIIEYVYPELPNHPYQAYRVTEYGKKWLGNSNE